MARSSPSSALSRLDLPTLGAADDGDAQPVAQQSAARVACARRAATPARAALEVAPAACRVEVDVLLGEVDAAPRGAPLTRMSCSRSAGEVARRGAPKSCSRGQRWRRRRCGRAPASATASAWARSSLPLRKARLVNSPAPAGRAPRCDERIAGRAAGRPGCRGSAARARPRRCSCAARASARRGRRRAAVRRGRRSGRGRDGASSTAAGVGDGGRRRRRCARRAGPLTRTMPMPPGPGGVAIGGDGVVLIHGAIVADLPGGAHPTGTSRWSAYEPSCRGLPDCGRRGRRPRRSAPLGMMTSLR